MTPRRAPIEPTRPRPSRWTSHGQDLTRLSHFSWFAQPFWIKHQLFLSFYQSFCYIVATVLSHFKELGHFLVATVNSVIFSAVLNHFLFSLQ
jgi:hypothetical protein